MKFHTKTYQSINQSEFISDTDPQLKNKRYTWFLRKCNYYVSSRTQQHVVSTACHNTSHRESGSVWSSITWPSLTALTTCDLQTHPMMLSNCRSTVCWRWLDPYSNHRVHYFVHHTSLHKHTTWQGYQSRPRVVEKPQKRSYYNLFSEDGRTDGRCAIWRGQYSKYCQQWRI